MLEELLARMGFRKSLRFGPLRVNLSGSGVSVSAGAGPARVVYKLFGAQRGKATLYAFGAPVKSKKLELMQRKESLYEPTLEELLRYTKLELADEERRLERNPRLYAVHQRQHDELYAALDELSPDAARSYLASWWENHRLYRGRNREA